MKFKDKKRRDFYFEKTLSFRQLPIQKLFRKKDAEFKLVNNVLKLKWTIKPFVFERIRPRANWHMKDLTTRLRCSQQF